MAKPVTNQNPEGINAVWRAVHKLQEDLSKIRIPESKFSFMGWIWNERAWSIPTAIGLLSALSVATPNGAKAKKCRKVLDFLYAAFPSKTPELERFNLISLYSIASQLLENYVIKERAAELADWFLKFESYRREQDQLPIDEADNEIVIYHEKTSHSTDAVDSLSWRHEFLLRKFFEVVPDVELKDDKRLFTHEQRLAIYRRDGGICKVSIKCRGEKCEWENWAADHIRPWSKGGKTTVENGQVSCVACNSGKKDSMVTAEVSAPLESRRG